MISHRITLARSPQGPVVEILDARVLMAFEDWGEPSRLIHYPDALAAFSSTPLTGTGQTIAIIDSGIDYTHASLGGGLGNGFKVIGGHDFVDGDNDPIDTYGHGTEVAGIIGANPFVADGLKHSGIAPGAKLVALRIDGDGQTSVPDERIRDALQWCVDHRVEYGITVVNISYGTGLFDEPTVSSIYGNQILALTDAGVTIVAASGNEGLANGLGIDTPAADPSVISVGSVDTTDTISSFSERGHILSLLAPGEFVYSTLRLGGFGTVDGTSFAAPFVAGTVALMKQHDPTLLPGDVQSILEASGVPNFDGDTESAPFSRLTFQRLDILSAMQLTDARLAADSAEQNLFGYGGNGNALAVDRFGITHFVYYDSVALTMRYSTRSTSGVWSKLQTIDQSVPFIGTYSSIAVDKFGRPSVAYFDGTNGDLHYAHFDGIKWAPQLLDVKNSTGLYPSLAFDRNDLPVIAYYRKTSGDLRVARQLDTGQWTFTNVDTAGDVGRDASISIDTAGRVGVAYADSTNGFLKYALFNPKLGAWSTITADQSCNTVSFISTRFDNDSNPVISYYDSGPADLKVARFSKRRWRADRVASKGGTGLFSTVFINNDNKLDVLFYDKRTNTTQRARGTTGQWQLATLDAAGGRFLNAAFDAFTGDYRYSVYDNATKKLLVRQHPL